MHLQDIHATGEGETEHASMYPQLLHVSIRRCTLFLLVACACVHTCACVLLLAYECRLGLPAFVIECARVRARARACQPPTHLLWHAQRQQGLQQPTPRTSARRCHRLWSALGSNKKWAGALRRTSQACWPQQQLPAAVIPKLLQPCKCGAEH